MNRVGSDYQVTLSIRRSARDVLRDLSQEFSIDARHRISQSDVIKYLADFYRDAIACKEEVGSSASIPDS
jgi:hypothetical protein